MTRRVFPAVLAVVLILVGLPSGSVPARADTTPELQAELASLLQQLAALNSQQSAASNQLAASEATYNQTASSLLAEQAQLATLNAQLANLSAEISANQQQETSARETLATLTRATYESVSGDTVMTAVLSAKDFTSAMQSLSGAESITTQIEGLETTLAHDQASLQSEQAQLQSDFAQASSLENQLSMQSNQLMVVVYQQDQIVATLDGPARALAAQIGTIEAELGYNTVVPTSSSCSNSFALGECTYYVATRRCIPWGGNADAWYYNAAKLGYQEGHTPEVGAVAVWWAGAGGASWVGHVAYVEAVGPGLAVGTLTGSALLPGEFEVSEMNATAGWDRVDYRIVDNDPSIFQGFIYGPG
ncbi:MAG: CHAP domain-containing protein [Candidatus Dormibacteria bacterium]